jgi:hypothetical protein
VVVGDVIISTSGLIGRVEVYPPTSPGINPTENRVQWVHQYFENLFADSTEDSALYLQQAVGRRRHHDPRHAVVSPLAPAVGTQLDLLPDRHHCHLSQYLVLAHFA